MKKRKGEAKFSTKGPGSHPGEEASVFEFRKLVETSQTRMWEEIPERIDAGTQC